MDNLPTSNNPVLLDESHSRFDFINKKFVFWITSVILFLVFFYTFFFSAPKNFPVNNVLNIKEGVSLRYISKYLEVNNVIRSRVAFETFVIILGGEKHLAYGDYLFESKLPVFAIAERLVKGDRHLAPVKVTIPEGFNVSDIAKVFASKLSNFKTDKFLLEAKIKEGYLFPDTYFFLTTDTDSDVLSAMNDNFEKKISAILPQIVASGKNEKEIITMASIIEKESKGDIDRSIISGILWKRISIGMPLQVDADMSTYKTKGLPKNPIGNPGIAAIEAAIYPKSSSYLYYLHDKEGNIHYARTFAEHILNKQKYLNK